MTYSSVEGTKLGGDYVTGMSHYFYSLGMLVTGRTWDGASPYLSAMDVLAGAIANDENEPPTIIAFMFNAENTTP